MRQWLAVMAVLALSASVATADYIDPPGWENDPYFTHQSWDFNTADNPIAPDGSPAVVSPGQPTGEFFAGTWLATDPATASGREGIWEIAGPLTADPITRTPSISLFIPNTPDPNRVKQIWFQATIWESTEDIDVLSYVISDDDDVYLPVFDDFTVLDESTGWGCVTLMFEIDPQPGHEWLHFMMDMAEGESLLIDQVDVDTRCIVPEPSTMAMLLGAALLGIIGLHRRR